MIMFEVKNTLSWINCRLDIAEERSGELEAMTVETIQN